MNRRKPNDWKKPAGTWALLALSLRFNRQSALRKAVSLTLILTLVLVPLLSQRMNLISVQAQVETCGGAGRIFQGCPLGGPFEAGLENQAINDVLALHQLPAGDRGRVLGWQRGELRALLYDKLLGVIKKAPASRTADEQAAVDALAARIKEKRVVAAQSAIDEYNAWDQSPCGYTPPPGFSYSPGSLCLPNLAVYYQGRPDPPKFEEFQAYGVARAFNEFNSQEAQKVAAGAARAVQFLGGVAAAGVAAGITLAIAASLSQIAIAAIFPFAFSAGLTGAVAAGAGATSAAAGVTASTTAIAGAVAIVVVAVVIAVFRGIDVFTADQIPGKLQSTKNDVMNGAVDLAQLITTGPGQTEVYAAFILMTMPDYPSADPVPAQQLSDPKFMLNQAGSPTTQDYLLKYKSWDNTNRTARAGGGWFIDKDAGNRESWTLSIDYLDWNGEQWTTSRSGTNFIHTKEGAADQSFESPEIRYKDWNGVNLTASLVVPELTIVALPVVLDRGHTDPGTFFVPAPQTLPIALVNSGGQALNTLAVKVNDAASAAATGVNISNLSVDSAGQVTATLTATCAASSPTFTLKVTDSLGQSKTTPLVIALTPIPYLTRNPLPATLPDGKVGVPYRLELISEPFLSTCGVGIPTLSLTSGKLPFGLALGPFSLNCPPGVICPLGGAGVIGAPSSGGSSTFTVTMSFSNGDAFSRTYTVNIAGDPVEMPSGLVSWWNAEHGIQDIANRNHGLSNDGFGTANFATGHVGLAFSFNGSFGSVQLPNNFFPFPAGGAGNTPFTFETWFKTASGGVIIGQQSSDPWGPPPPQFTPGLYVGVDGKLRAQMFATGAINPITGSAAVNDDRFHHVAVVYNGVEQIVYLDGNEMGRATHTQAGQSGNYRYQIGVGYKNGWPSVSTTNNSSWWGFNGLIDEPTLFSRALDAEEVRAIFGAGQAGKILALWESLQNAPTSCVLS